MTIDAKNEQIIELLCSGLTNKEIADRVYLSEIRVKERIAEMKQSLEEQRGEPVKNTLELIAILYEMGIIKPKAA